MAAGDLLFYEPARGDHASWAVAVATGGPYSHVAVDLGDGSVIAAISPGGVVHGAEPGYAAAVTTSSRLADLDAGLAFVRSLVGRPYSFADCVDVAVRLAWASLHPSATFGPISVAIPVPPRFAPWAQPRAFDCSSLAARFLIAATCAGLPAGLVANPDVSSPNSLYRELR